MAAAAWYTDWFNSPFYHKLYLERNEQEAAAFIQQLIKHLHPDPGCRMLDIGCGRGRHSKILASMGFMVTGLDISPRNIEAAKEAENPDLEFYVHDMRLPFRTNYYDFAFNFFTSFGYFRTRREHDDAIRTIARSLKPGGIFVMDYLNVHYAESHMLLREEKTLHGTEYSIHRWDDDTHFYKKITIRDASLYAPQTYTEKVAKFSLGDFTDMFSFQDLQVQEVFGDYQFGAYDTHKMPRLIIIARKGKEKPRDQEKRLYSDGRSTDPLT